LRATILALFVALAFAAGAIATGVGDSPTTYPAKGGTYVGVRPTAVGLPQLGATGTVGAGEIVKAVRDYHDSGQYDKDLAAVAGNARGYLDARLASWPRKSKLRPAIVLDIDETSLSNYRYLQATDFTNTVGALALAVINADTPAIRPTLNLFEAARAHRVAVFFITGRPDNIPGVRSQTVANLRAAGYQGWAGLSLNPGGLETVPYKSGERARIEGRGYRIVANVGDQESDLQGGHADRAFKLPNPFYFIGP
jgi:acid phosphatase